MAVSGSNEVGLSGKKKKWRRAQAVGCSLGRQLADPLQQHRRRPRRKLTWTVFCSIVCYCFRSRLPPPVFILLYLAALHTAILLFGVRILNDDEKEVLVWRHKNLVLLGADPEKAEIVAGVKSPDNAAGF